ncbi:LacI family DNA-binding transcriptional regulator [Edwardsiella ictaluri]|uniref:Formate hydrogenlyase regulatory protein HycA, putative n=1 Tax=Edwardsiella ictaluri (strain 93-146) TaxID=634503 RepID=C5BGK2_EDWI9|nr:LacI family DNA-binding transcriptional regulator [Edwardsiella ictaluri]ACR70408.1 formate hydrogenlyase regulatory protein HycA, putative [Edwardsiella ictaluri 93-146]ARD39318.1 LacI family transcriptional regulator [Edwardsiella ictaluri]AVZ82745.1 LacI family DNA-binding transcriptional regulator [Edwardsiella ictaluri]EKS7763953.1 LacI family DNA-binding transcriptional regulator [Edwardsiella ictaluri]EKS7770733.1 LacI family DNA-binding transcriptional regulator [Edwardsiella ictalu
MITMLDVARRAGVSKATVSRVLNATGQVRQSTRSAVFCAMEELGYRPNLLAQALANQTSNTLGLVISHFDGPYFGRLLRQAAAQVEASGKQLIVTDGHDTPDGERQAVQMLSDRRCDAIILYTRFMAETDLMKLVSQYPSLVVINRALPQAAQRCILFEQRAAARQAVEYLIERGHRRIACITLTIDTPTGQARLQGYHDALQAHALSASPQDVAHGNNSVEGGYHACLRLLENHDAPFSALFCCNDDMAIGALRALRQAGIRVPQEVSLFGFDDQPIAAYLMPALSTVYLPIDAMIAAAIQQALRLSRGDPVDTLPPFRGEMRLRESVADAPAVQ